MDLYRDFVGEGDLCFDVGANVGRKTEALLSLGADVISFEPQPRCAEEIRLRCDGLGSLCVEMCAVGREQGEVYFDLNTRSGLAKVVSDPAESEGEVVSVPVYPLDYFVEKYGVPEFCKIDVEGHEMAVLEGLSSYPRSMSLEYHTREKSEVNEILEIINLLNNSYKNPVFNYTEGKNRFFSLNEFVEINVIKEKFCRRWRCMSGFGDLFVKEKK